MNKPKRRIETLGVLFASISAMVGSGWLFGPLFAAQISGPSSVISWVIGGGLMMILSLAFAELTVAIPISGGATAYAFFTHGNLLGFIMGWVLWAGLLFQISAEVLATIQYGSNYFPWLIQPIESKPLSIFGIIVAGIMMLGISLVNNLSGKATSDTNKYITWWKLLIPAFVAFMFLFSNPYWENMTHPAFAPQGIKGILTAIATGGVIYAFNGFQYGLMYAGEVRNPSKSIPIAAIGSIVICIFLYCLLQVSFVVALLPEFLTSSWAKLSFPGDAGPLAGLAALIGLGWLVHILYLDAVVSPLGAALVQSGSAARNLYTMAIGGLLPARFSVLNKGGVPSLAVWLNFFVGMIFILLFNNLQSMISVLSTVLVLTYIAGPISLLVLRKLQPDMKRPFRVPFVGLIAYLGFYICNMLILWTGFYSVCCIIVFVLLGVLLFFLGKNKKTSMDFMNAAWIFPYLIGLGVITYLGEFQGGIQLIPFGWDFLVMGTFSLFILIIATRQAISVEKFKNYFEFFNKQQ